MNIFLFLIFCFFLNYCENENLNVHIIPQSHCDVGWLLTKEQYFEKAVRKTLNSVLDSLSKHSDRKFIWVETYLFFNYQK
jgi:hypothetical protein